MKGAKGKGTAKRDALKPVDDKKVGKRKAPAKAVGKSKAKGSKAIKDPNKPKRPPSAFFVFLEEFRQTFKKENPTIKAVSAIFSQTSEALKSEIRLKLEEVGKAGGEKWKSLSAAEKAPYEAKAAKRKTEYEKQMNAYNKKQESDDDDDDDDDESDKSKSEVDEESAQENVAAVAVADDDDEDDDDDVDDEDDDEDDD